MTTLGRRVTAVALCAVGAACVMAASARYVSGVVRQDMARHEWEGRRAHADVEAILNGVHEPSAARPAPTHGEAVGRIVIAKIGVDDIIFEGVDQHTLDAGPGHVPLTPLPGDVGNAVVSAHRDRHFARLNELGVGDTVRTETDRHGARWVVVARTIMSKEQALLAPTADRTLTLTTCWPPRYVGPAPDRLILTAKPISVAP